MEVAQQSLNEVNGDAELPKRFMIDNETRVYGCDVEIKAQSSQRKYSGSPRPKNARQARSNVSVMVHCVHRFQWGSAS